MIIRSVVLTLVGLLLVGCGTKTEEEELAEFKSSLRYKAYWLASDKAVDVAVAAYNQQVDPNSMQMDTEMAHSLLGVLWFMQQKGKFCYIEADVLDDVEGLEYPMLPRCLRILALYNMGLEQLSASQYQTLKEDLAAEEGTTPEEVELEHKLLLSALILVGLQQGDLGIAQFAAETLEATTQIDYLGPLVGAVAKAQGGHPIEACKELRELAQSERFRGHVRELMAEAADTIENADTTDKGQITKEVVAAVGARLTKQIIDDIFTAEDQKTMLDTVRKLPEKITGGTDETASLTPEPKEDSGPEGVVIQ
ncbi:MAG: hypothetical protein ABFR90_04845 [Planctomycetota bacterium]